MKVRVAQKKDKFWQARGQADPHRLCDARSRREGLPLRARYGRSDPQALAHHRRVPLGLDLDQRDEKLGHHARGDARRRLPAAARGVDRGQVWHPPVAAGRRRCRRARRHGRRRGIQRVVSETALCGRLRSAAFHRSRYGGRVRTPRAVCPPLPRERDSCPGVVYGFTPCKDPGNTPEQKAPKTGDRTARSSRCARRRSCGATSAARAPLRSHSPRTPRISLVQIRHSAHQPHAGQTSAMTSVALRTPRQRLLWQNPITAA
eukprot:1605662-Prymnesium_polylepis.1